jgi:FlaG/FlaF family flagellin (archaellin)
MPYPVKVDQWVLTAVVTASATDQTPTAGTKNGETVTATEFDNIPIAGASWISVQAVETALDSNSIDINIHASCDNGTNYDSTSHPYTSMNYDADTDGIKTFNVTPGPTHIRIRTDENEGATIALTVNVVVTWGMT